jgi:signal transduction protein with GAF and PtsI domain
LLESLKEEREREY